MTYKIYDKPVESPPYGIYSVTRQFTIALVTWDWDSEIKNKFPEEWDEFHKPRSNTVIDGAIRLWLKIYHNELYTWLENHEIDYVGIQSGEWIENDIIESICIRMHKEDELIAFRLRWC